MRALCLIAGLLCVSARARAQDEASGRRLQALLHAHQADVYDCVSKSVKPPAGEMLVRIFVGASGTVGKAEVLKDESGAGPGLSACLTGKARAWDVSSLGADVGDQIVFPLKFHPEATATSRGVTRIPIEHPTLGKWMPVYRGALMAKIFVVDQPTVFVLPDHTAAYYVLDGKGIVKQHQHKLGSVATGDLVWLAGQTTMCSFVAQTPAMVLEIAPANANESATKASAGVIAAAALDAVKASLDPGAQTPLPFKVTRVDLRPDATFHADMTDSVNFVLAGEAALKNGVDVKTWDIIAMQQGDAASLHVADKPMHLLHISLPRRTDTPAKGTTP